MRLYFNEFANEAAVLTLYPGPREYKSMVSAHESGWLGGALTAKRASTDDAFLAEA